MKSSRSFSMNYFLDSYKYIWAWSTHMEVVGQLYMDSQHQWIERDIKAWDTFLSINGPRERKRANVSISKKTTELSPLAKKRKSPMTEQIPKDTRNKLQSQRREKDLETLKKLMMNMTHLEYYVPRLRDKETKKLPPCFSRQNNVHKFNPNKNYWLGYGCDENEKLYVKYLKVIIFHRVIYFPQSSFYFAKKNQIKKL